MLRIGLTALVFIAIATPAHSQVGSLVSQVATDNYVEVRSQPGQYFYNYAPDVIYFNGMYHMYWCGGVGAEGDYILHAQSPNSYGPFSSSTNSAPFTYDVALRPTTRTTLMATKPVIRLCCR